MGDRELRASGGGTTGDAAAHDMPTSGDRPGGAIGLDLDGSVAVGAQHRSARVVEGLNGDQVRMAVAVAGACADEARRRMQRRQERWAGP